MFLLSGDQPHIDFGLNILVDLLRVIDAGLEEVEEDMKRCPDADGWGLLDTADGLCGMGFTVCQQYITATASYCHLGKKEALPCGPEHSCGDSVVSIVNNAANAWKHGDEWLMSNAATRQQLRTQEGLEGILSNAGDEYALTVVLARLVPPGASYRFANLIPLLAEWRNDMFAKFGFSKRADGA